MDNIIENTKKMKLVDMEQADISTEDKPIIGTDALATCVGVLLYNEEKKQAIVAHVVPDKLDVVDYIADLFIKYDWISSIIKYKIIDGYYDEHYHTKERLENEFNGFLPFDESEVKVLRNEEINCHSFAFDSRTGKFISDEVLYGEDYQIINNIKKSNKR